MTLYDNFKDKLMIPGEYFLKKDDIQLNKNSTTASVVVINTGDRPVQIGSHFHFFEVNKLMEFDRTKAFGMRLNIAAATAVRFEPGEEKEVELVALAGNKKVFGFNNLVDGELHKANAKAAVKKLKNNGFKSI